MHGITLYIAVFIFGSVAGSFLNVCIHRIPRGQSIVFPSSRCPSCNTSIRVWDNIPLLSYMMLGGKCRDCRTGISLRYPLVEALNAILYVAAVARFGLGWHTAAFFLLLSAFIVITFIDLDFQIIPDCITLPGIPLGIVLGGFILPDPFMRFSQLGLKASAAGALTGFGFFYLVAVIGSAAYKKEAMGGGDIKMMGMVGGFLGWKGVLLTTFLGSLLGSLIGISLMLLGGKERGTKIPFGPFLAAGAMLTLFFGQEVLNWYLHGRY